MPVVPNDGEGDVFFGDEHIGKAKFTPMQGEVSFNPDAFKMPDVYETFCGKSVSIQGYFGQASGEVFAYNVAEALIRLHDLGCQVSRRKVNALHEVTAIRHGHKFITVADNWADAFRDLLGKIEH